MLSYTGCSELPAPGEYGRAASGSMPVSSTGYFSVYRTFCACVDCRPLLSTPVEAMAGQWVNVSVDPSARMMQTKQEPKGKKRRVMENSVLIYNNAAQTFSRSCATPVQGNQEVWKIWVGEGLLNPRYSPPGHPNCSRPRQGIEIK